MTQFEVSKDLRGMLGPTRDQGARPTCLAFAVSDAHAALRDDWNPLSCECAFYHAQRRVSRPPDSGALLHPMLEALREDGQPIESGWPYLTSTPEDLNTWVPPRNMGQLFNRNGGDNRHTVEAIIQQLEEDRPVILLMTLSRAFYLVNAEGVVDPSPAEAPDPFRRHAVVAVGHGKIETQTAVLVRNSWGPTWGNGGHALLTESYLKPRLFGAAILLEDINVPSNPVTT
jgi:hypothetical protein